MQKTKTPCWLYTKELISDFTPLQALTLYSCCQGMTEPRNGEVPLLTLKRESSM